MVILFSPAVCLIFFPLTSHHIPYTVYRYHTTRQNHTMTWIRLGILELEIMTQTQTLRANETGNVRSEPSPATFLPFNTTLNLCTMAVAPDPMDVIPPSELAASDVPSTINEDRNMDFEDNQFGTGAGCPSLQLTPAGIRLALARKLRPKPLLKLVCKACQLSTHDADPLVPCDCVERLC